MSWMDEEIDLPWVKVLSEASLGVGEMRLGRVGIRQVVVVRTAKEIRIFRNACPHAGAPLSGGKLSENMLMCPRHRWEFDVRDGSCPEHPLYSLRAYNVRVKDGWILAQEAEQEIW